MGIGPDFDRLVEAGLLPDIDGRPQVELSADTKHDLGHVAELLDSTTPTPPVRELNEHGYPRTLPITIINQPPTSGEY